MKIPDWIILRYDVTPNFFECERCKARRETFIPASIAGFVKQSEAFAEDHKFCKEK